MSNNTPETLEQAQREIERLRAQLEAAKQTTPTITKMVEPIAIIGMGCRFPGGINTPDAFWELLANGEEALGDIPASRWDVDAYYDPERPVAGKMYVRQGCYLDNIDQFDPQFFKISPREATSLDPQQRLLLEVSWETLEHAGIAPDSLKGSQTGIFVGQYWDDYSMQRIYAGAPDQIDRYSQLSALRGLSAGRIAHLLDIHGPTLQLDTACSSASLTVHLACQSLRNGESDLALAGGVSLILAPEHLIGICQMKALAPDGRCKTFDAKADGFGQGEGCGMVALKRLSDAYRDGDSILALIRGSAVNHDGHSRTVTTPSGPAQRLMLQQALANAGVGSDQIDYVETHGTGTPLGDPIEVLALARVLCQEREQPLLLGSVKSNIGHLDAAAGIAGLMKVVLALQHGAIPAQLHFDEPNPRIPWNDWPIKVPTELTPWQSEQRIAGISAFGMSGTNVHLIVEQAPSPLSVPVNQTYARPQHLLTLSATDKDTLRDLAQVYLNHLRTTPEDKFADTCFSAATGRNHFNHRLALVAESAETATQKLTAFIENDGSHGLFHQAPARKPPKIAFLFTGQGAQYVGMGQQLYQTQPTFRYHLDHCAEILGAHLDQPLLDVLWSGDNIDQTAYTQPALFAVEYSLAQLWLSWGIEPDVMMGHSVGEYVAACLAEVFTLEQGLELIAARGRLMQSLPAGGEMISVMADEATVAANIAPYDSEVSIAAVNGPNSIVIAGQDLAVQSIVAELHKQDIKTTQLQVSHAFHSPLMEPILAEFSRIAARISYATPARTIVSNATGKILTDEQLASDYWVRHLRDAVRFADGMSTLQQELKIDTFLEIGPKPILLGMARGCVPAQYGSWLPSLRPDAEWSTLLASVAQLYVKGANIDWTGFERDYSEQRSKIVLPNYPWRRQRYWIDVDNKAAMQVGPVLHPLLQRCMPSALKSIIFESQLSAANPAYLADHVAFGNVILPASAYLEMALMVAKQLLNSDRAVVSDISIQQALILTDEPSTLQFIVTPDDQAYRFELFSLSDRASNDQWISHATGKISRLDSSQTQRSNLTLESLKSQYSKQISLEDYQQSFTERGMDYGPAFQATEALYYSPEAPNTALAHVRLPKMAKASGSAQAYHLHPVLLDACFRVSEALFENQDKDKLYLPFGITTLQWLNSPTSEVLSELWVKATGTQQENTRIVDLQLFNGAGRLIARVDGLMLRAASVAALHYQTQTDSAKQTPDVLTQWLYQLSWQAQNIQSPPTPNAKSSGVWLILADTKGIGEELATMLEAQNESCLIAFAGADYQRMAANHYQLNPNNAVEFERLLNHALPGALPQTLAGIIHLWSLSFPEQDYLSAPVAVLHLLQALNRLGKTAPLWLITNGTQALNQTGQNTQALWQSSLWGLARVIQAEHPELSCVCVDLGEEIKELPLLLNELHFNDGENQIALCGGQRYVARLTPLDLTEESPPLTMEIYNDACYLITGGLGALGLTIAEHMVTAGARHLILSGRSGAVSEQQQVALKRLQASGAEVQVIQADVANAEDVAKLLTQAKHALRGVIHAAGVIDDGMLTQQTAQRFEKVAAPKVQGAWHLHTQTQEHPLDFFVMFSSVASLMGSTGQANYAAANAFMDSLAHYRQSIGLPALAINWGPWGDVGMAASEPVKRRLANEGWDTISSQQGWQIMQVLLPYNISQAGVLPIDWTQFMRQVAGAAQSPMLARLNQQVATNSDQTLSSNHQIIGQLASAAANQRVSLLNTYLQERVAQTLQVSVTQLDDQQSLSNLGIDSLTSVELRAWVRSDLEVDIPLEHFLTTPTISDLAALINDQLNVDSTQQAEAADVTTTNEKSGWITRPNPNPHAQLRLFCFPYAGGSASAFRDWAKALPAEIELCPIQLPGREERLKEELFTDLSILVNALLPELRPQLDKPFAFFGHSMGAMISYEVVRQLQQHDDPLPLHLFLSSRAAPQIVNNSTSLRFLPDQEFIDELQRLYDAVPEAIQQSKELQELFLPILRADVALLETHNWVSGATLKCPISVFGGEQDRSINHAALAAWSKQTDAKFAQHMFSGGHFYLNNHVAAIVETITRELLPQDLMN